MTETPQPEFTIDFDPAEIRAKYQAELVRRATTPRRAADRSTDRHAHGAAGADLWSAPITRESQEADVDLLIIGGGFAGLLTAVRAQEAGGDSIKIVEAAGDFGGVWYWNRYPNAQCDTEGYLYFPLLEETGYMPTRRFPFASEIFEHAQRIGRHFGLTEHTLFQTEAEHLEWSDADHHWTLTTNRGDRIRARFVMYSRGAFGVPRTPDVPGLAEFPGEVFHASRWNYDYTGGAPGTVPDRLKDQRVAVIGSAATAVQVVSALAPVTGHLYVVQRTPTALLGDRDPAPTDADWYRELPAGWQRERRRSFDGSTSGLIPEVDLVDDTWSNTFRAAMTAERVLGDRTLADLDPEQAQLALELADMEIMERARAYTRTQVNEPELAARLEPWYGMRCKRITFDDGYLAAFNRDNVTLIAAPAAVDTVVGVQQWELRTARSFAEARIRPDHGDGEFTGVMRTANIDGMRQDGHETRLAPGDMALYDTSRPYTLEHDDGVHCLGVVIPEDRVTIAHAALRSLTAVRMPGDDAVTVTTAQAIERVQRSLDGMAIPTRYRLGKTFVSLFETLCMNWVAEGAALERDPRAELRESVLRYIDEHLADPELSPQRIADEHFVSLRSLHALTQHSGASVARWIRTMRLDRCRDDLSDPSLAHVTVAEIGARWGFLHPPHFTTVFRTQCGETPSAYRRRLLG